MSALRIAFEPPERGLGSCAAKGRPIDLEHLARQTMGDKKLETEVLHLFAREARCCLDRLGREPEADRAAIAHRLKGAARGVGAFAIAAAAEALEANPADPVSMAKLMHTVADAENFICGLSR